MAGIEYLANLTQPALAYKWEVEVRSPYVTDVNDLKFRARTSSIPDSVVQPIEVPYKEFTYYFPGRDGSAHTVDLAFWEGEDLSVYKSFARWHKAVLEVISGVQLPKVAIVGTVEMRLLSSTDSVIGTWILVNAWPENIQPISLDYTANDAVTVTVTLRYDYCEKPFL